MSATCIYPLCSAVSSSGTRLTSSQVTATTSLLIDTSSFAIPTRSTMSTTSTATPLPQISSNSTTSSTGHSTSSLSKGASAGIGVGISIGVVAVLAWLLWYFSFHERAKDHDIELSKAQNKTVYRHHQNEVVTEYERPATGNSRFAHTIDSSSMAPRKSASGHPPTGLTAPQEATRAMLTNSRNGDERNFI
ncbi:hypothetical protein EJ08DRAFT_651601 [Tothia fuscella]|uniref:Uncharacterized protein n=1 Tax=Tothia fuscella TaxID=1048955 RepID=A0A9P4NM19_9PEZI|nr:hypothetical protein EJ08DRAFT_651601 [Tothia fuscella]